MAPNTEVTVLSPEEEAQFLTWIKGTGVTDLDHADSHYDYRGFWKATHGASHTKGQHFPDTFKEHGHPSFSQESQYSRGVMDGGMWTPDQFTPEGFAVSHAREDLFAPQPPMAVSHRQAILKKLQP